MVTGSFNRIGGDMAILLFLPDFTDKYTEYVLRHTLPTELETRTQMMQGFYTMYENPIL